jgi:hypothetical protein
MRQTSATKIIKTPKSQYPRCLRCGKAVDFVEVKMSSTRANHVIVEYGCHGEHVSQEMTLAELEIGLENYTAFNDYTSGLMICESKEARRGVKNARKNNGAAREKRKSNAV